MLANSPDADHLDSVSLEERKQSNLDSDLLKRIFDQMIRTEYTLKPKDVSMLYFLSTPSRSNGGISTIAPAVPRTYESWKVWHRYVRVSLTNSTTPS